MQAVFSFPFPLRFRFIFPLFFFFIFILFTLHYFGLIWLSNIKLNEPKGLPKGWITAGGLIMPLERLRLKPYGWLQCTLKWHGKCDKHINILFI